RIATPTAAFLKRALRDMGLVDVLTHDVWHKFDPPGFRQVGHAMHFTEREYMSVVLDGNQAPVLDFVVPADDAPHVQSPYSICAFLVIAKLAERDTEFRCPA